MERCTDSCGLFTRDEDLRTRYEYGQPYHCCRWCRLPDVKTVEESIARRRADRDMEQHNAGNH